MASGVRNTTMDVPAMNAFNSSAWLNLKKLICFRQIIISRGVWFGDNPLDFIGPVMLLQVMVIFYLSRALHWLLRPLKQPKFICNVLAGIILGPSVLGRNVSFGEKVFHPNGTYLMHVFSVFGSTYFVFLIAVKMDSSILRTARNSWSIALTGFAFPLFTAFSLLHALKRNITEIRQGYFPFFVASSLSLTSFPVIAHALDELNLINSELGQLALSLSMIYDVMNLFIVAVLATLKQRTLMKSSGVLVSLVALVSFTVFVIRPAILMIIKKTPKGKPVKETYIIAIFAGVAVMAVISDMIGLSMLIGALLLGLAIPDGPPLGSTLTDKAEIFVSEVFLPFVFVHVGYKTNTKTIKNWKAFAYFQLILVAAYAAKLIGTFLAALHCRIIVKNAILLSLIMSIKGIIDLFLYRKWLVWNFIDSQTFTQLVLSMVALTMIVTPIIDIYYKRQMRLNQNLSTKHDGVKSIVEFSNRSEFRIVSCIHSQENVHSTITLLEGSNPTESSPLSVHVIHLVEFAGRNIPLLIPHHKQRRSGNANWANSEYIMRAFENYSNNSKGPVTIHPFISIAPYKCMHDSICRLAQDNLIHLIITPFCGNQRFEGENQTIAAMRHFSISLQESAPCTVGILVDRSLSCQWNSVNFSYRVAVIFIGGADDREALALASRMSSNTKVSITVLHFIFSGIEKRDYDERRQLDEFMVNEFKLKNVRNPRVVVREMVVDDGVKMINSLRCIENKFNLIMVGRRHGKLTMVDEEMSDFIDIAELGVIGDMLVSSDICGGEVSVLVMQHANDLDDSHRVNSSDNSQSSLKDSDFQRFNGG